jgi:chromosome segregation ATPase
LEIDEIETILNSLSKSSLRESVEKDLMDINKEAEHEVLQSKLDKIDALIDLRRSKLGKLDEDEDMKALTDKKKVKELEKDIKKLEVARNKVEKMMSKFKGKKSSNKKVIDEDEPIDENLDVNPEYVEDATERLDAGQKVDSIRDTYSNLGIDQKSDLTDYLNTIAPDDLTSDYVY